MYPVQHKNEFLPYELPDVSGYLRDTVPTFERTLDQYFDNHFNAIIDEWQLLREDDLRILEQRLNAVSEAIGHLSSGKEVLISRVSNLEAALRELEGSL